jgi:zeaxanthin epoxidase
MKIIASCILALGALSQEASAFSSTKSPVRVTQQQRSLSKAPVLLNAASVDDSESESVTTNGALDTIPADPSYDLLGLPARPGRPLKIAIAGGGVGGLTAAYYMLKKVRRRCSLSAKELYFGARKRGRVK